MEVSELPQVYGCCGLMDMCADNDIMSLSFEGTNKFMDWIGWELTNICLIKKQFLSFVRAESDELGGHPHSATHGYLADPCGDSHGVEWGGCDFTLEDFGLLRRHGPTRNATRNNVKYCDAQPRYRLDGTPIKDDAEFDMRLATEANLQDLKRMIINGNDATPGQFNGLEQLVSTGYHDSLGHHCKIMDSIVIDWNTNTMSGGAGITWNGAAVGATYDFVDVLLAVFRRVMDRIQMAPALSSQTMSPGDMVFVAPTHVLRCLLDHYTCWSVCAGAQYNEVVIQSYEARTFRNNLNGGMFQMGKIFLDGFEIPLIGYNWGLIKGPTLADAYLLTGNVGSVKLFNGQLLDMRDVPKGYPEAMYSYTDGGRLLTWLERDKTCVYREVEMQPRLLMWAPWAQVRFQDIKCTQPGGPMSADPWETSFFPESSFVVPTCPD